MSSGIASPAGSAGSGGGRVTRTVSPELTWAAGSRTVRASIRTWPSRINAFRRERDSAGMRAASTRSSRSPASSGATVTVSLALSVMAQPMSNPNPTDADAAQVIAKARRLMLTVMGATFLALAVVLGIIGYRLFRTGDSACC